MRVIDFGRQHSQEKCASKFCACQEKLHVKKKMKQNYRINCYKMDVKEKEAQVR